MFRRNPRGRSIWEKYSTLLEEFTCFNRKRLVVSLAKSHEMCSMTYVGCGLSQRSPSTVPPLKKLWCIMGIIWRIMTLTLYRRLALIYPPWYSPTCIPYLHVWYLKHNMQHHKWTAQATGVEYWIITYRGKGVSINPPLLCCLDRCNGAFEQS